MYIKRKYSGFLIIILLVFFGCGKKDNTKAWKKIEVTVTGLDGNGVAEKNITNDLMAIKGVKTISFNYLNNQVVVLFDTTITPQQEIITTILKTNDGKHKVLDVKTNTEPLKKQEPVKPNPQEDIKDDTGNEYRNSG